MRAAVIAYTVNGAILAEKLRHLSDDETDIYVSAKSAKYIDAENIIASSGPEDKTVPKLEEDKEDFLDESDDIGDIDDGMSIQDIDEVEEIKEEA